MDCLFCKIAAGTISVNKLYEDEDAIAFADIEPKAPEHFLVVPKKHIASLDHIAKEDDVLLGHLLALVPQIARAQQIGNGFRTVINSGADGGQTVPHLHLHVLGGRPMHWPPG